MNAVSVEMAWVMLPAARSAWALATLLARLVPRPTPWTAWWRSASWASAPLTVTAKDVETGLFESSESVAVQVTVVVPIANGDPEAGEQAGTGPVVSSGSVTN